MFQEIKIKFAKTFHKIERTYEKYERRIGPTGILIGFTIDLIMFRRIDLFFENVLLMFYILVAMFGITIVNLVEGEKLRGRFFQRMRLWLPLIIQYAFGGLFSAFAVFYIKSASFLTSWPFFLVIFGIMMANELLRKKYMRTTLHMSIFFLALYSFAIFYLPIIFKSMSVWVFVMSGLISLGIMTAFTLFLTHLVPKRMTDVQRALLWTVGIIFASVNVLYFTNTIPPIPLALKEGGVYHRVTHLGSGNYEVEEEVKKWYEHLSPTNTFHWTLGSGVYILASVFAPTELKTDVFHQWQYYDTNSNRWIDSTRIPYPIIGGKDGGYRGYSVKQAVFPGRWRVDIETERGQVIGRMRFTIEESDTKPDIEIKQFD